MAPTAPPTGSPAPSGHETWLAPVVIPELRPKPPRARAARRTTWIVLLVVAALIVAGALVAVFRLT